MATENVGIVSTKSIQKDLLGFKNLQGENPWQNQYNAINEQLVQSQKDLLSDYASANTEAYISYLNSQQALKNSGIVGSYKSTLRQDLDTAINEAYDTYRSQYAENMQNIVTSAQKATAAVDEDLYTTASNLAKVLNYTTGEYYNKIYEESPEFFDRLVNRELTDYVDLNYVDELRSRLGLAYDVLSDEQLDLLSVASDEELASVNLTKSDVNMLQKYRKLGNDPELKAQYDEREGLLRRKLTQQELADKMFDKEGSLNAFGTRVIEQLQNWGAQSGEISDFWKSLESYDANLSKWVESSRLDYSTFEGSNKGLMRVLTGKASYDDTYTFLEDFGGLSGKQIDAIYRPFELAAKRLSNMAEKRGKDKAKSITKETKELTGSLKQLTVDMGVSDALGIDWDVLEGTINEAVVNSKSQGDLAAEFFKGFGAAMGFSAINYPISGAAGVAMTGATLSELAAVNGVSKGAAFAGAASNPVGWALLAAEALAGIIWGSIKVDKARTKNKEYAINATNAFNEISVATVNLMKSMQGTRNNSIQYDPNYYRQSI